MTELPPAATDTLSLLVHAPSKVGKSTLGSTSPLPLVVFDVEGGWRFIREVGFRSGVPLVKKVWDPSREAPPRHDGTWDVCVVTVTTWKTLTDGYAWLASGQHDFRSLVFDSVTEAQRKLKAQLRGLEQMRIQDWGDLLVQMDSLIRSMRDLVHVPRTSLRVVMFIAETEMKDGKWRPAMQGQIGRAMPYWVDLVGYLYAEQVPDENGQSTRKVLRLLIGQHPQFEAGERVQGLLGDVVTSPNVSQMMKVIFDVGGLSRLTEAVPLPLPAPVFDRSDPPPPTQPTVTPNNEEVLT